MTRDRTRLKGLGGLSNLGAGLCQNAVKGRVWTAMLTERLRDPEANVIEVDLSGIPNHNHIDVLIHIHEIFN